MFCLYNSNSLTYFRWKGDCGGAKQLLFPANLVEEYNADEDAVKPNAESAEAAVVQKGVIDIQGCTVGES